MGIVGGAAVEGRFAWVIVNLIKGVKMRLCRMVVLAAACTMTCVSVASAAIYKAATATVIVRQRHYNSQWNYELKTEHVKPARANSTRTEFNSRVDARSPVIHGPFSSDRVGKMQATYTGGTPGALFTYVFFESWFYEPPFANSVDYRVIEENQNPSFFDSYPKRSSGDASYKGGASINFYVPTYRTIPGPLRMTAQLRSTGGLLVSNSVDVEVHYTPVPVSLSLGFDKAVVTCTGPISTGCISDAVTMTYRSEIESSGHPAVLRFDTGGSGSPMGELRISVNEGDWESVTGFEKTLEGQGALRIRYKVDGATSKPGASAVNVRATLTMI